MPGTTPFQVSFDSAAELHQRTINPQIYHTVPSTSRWSREVAEEARINRMIGFGQHRPVNSLLSQANVVNRLEVDGSSQFSTPPNSASSSQGEARDLESPYRRMEQFPFVTYQEDDEPAGLLFDTDLSSSQVSSERHPYTPPSRNPHSPFPSIYRHPSSVSTTDAEEFYRSSMGYMAGLERGRSQMISERPSTPYQRDIPSAPSTSDSSRASVALTSSQRRASVNGSVLSPAPPAANDSPLRCRYGHRCTKTPPPRLPHNYRAERAFSFNRLPSPTPFSTQDARPISPSHWLHNVPRIDGVDLELRAMNQSIGRKGAVHRTLWPEERREMMEEVHAMKVNLVGTAGIVRDEEVKAENAKEQDEEQEGNKKKKHGWLKKLCMKKKKDKKDRVPLTINRTHTFQVTSTQATSPSSRRLGDAAPTQPMSVPLSSSQDQPYLFADTTVVAGSSPTTTDTTISLSPEKLASDFTRKVSRSMSPRQPWWRCLLPRAGNHVSRSDESKRRAGYRRIVSSSKSLGLAETK
jgi:hypothetical protein